MSNKKIATKKVNHLLVFVLQGFASVTSPTPGMIRTYLKEEHAKKVDYATARSLQGMFKRRQKELPTETRVSDRLRHSVVHGQ